MVQVTMSSTYQLTQQMYEMNGYAMLPNLPRYVEYAMDIRVFPMHVLLVLQ